MDSATQKELEYRLQYFQSLQRPVYQKMEAFTKSHSYQIHEVNSCDWVVMAK